LPVLSVLLCFLSLSLRRPDQNLGVKIMNVMVLSYIAARQLALRAY